MTQFARRLTGVFLSLLAGISGAPICGLQPLAHAGGLQSPPTQARALALGSATVALTSDPEDFSRNPALLGSSTGTRLTLGAALLVPEFRFFGITPSETETKAEPVFIFPPSFALSFRLSDQFTVGFSAGAPFLARSEWYPTWTGRQLATSFEHRTGVLAPAAAFSPFSGVTIGASVPLALTKHVMTSWIVEAGAAGAPGNAYQRTVTGESGVQLGFQGGILVAGDLWSFGGSYSTAKTVSISDARASLSTSDSSPGREVYSGQPASISMKLPAEMAVGATVTPIPALILTTELDLVMWSAATEIRYEIPESQDGYVIPQDWKDSYRIGIGAEYRLSDLDLRIGFSYDSSPIPDATLHPAYPDANRYGFSLGLGYRVGPGLLLDFGVSSFAFDSRSVDDSRMTIVDEITGEPGKAFNGSYRMAMTTISISISYLWR